MEPIKISERLKYYRNILDIGQKALVDENISINLIKYVEGGKRRLTVHKAMILSDKFNAIAKEKGIELNVTVKDLLMSDEEYAQKVCLDELRKQDDKIYDEEKYNEILDIARKYNLDEVFIDAYEKIGKYYYAARDYKTAIHYDEQALELASKAGNVEKKIKLLNTIGACYHSIENYIKALDFYNESYNILQSTKINDKKFESKLLYNLALCYKKLKRIPEAMDVLNLLLTMRDFDESGVINGMIVKANIYLEEQQYEQALQLYKAISAYGSKYMYVVFHNIAYAFLKLNKVKESIEFLTESISQQLEDHSPFLTMSLINMGITYRDEKLYLQAITFYEYAINNAIKFNQVEDIIECYKNLFMLYNITNKHNTFNNIVKKIINFKRTAILDEAQIGLLEEIIQEYS